MRPPLPPAHASEERTQWEVRKKVRAEELEPTQEVGGTAPDRTQPRRSLVSLGFETLQVVTV